MSRARWLGLAAAILTVAAALWVLSPGSRSPKESPEASGERPRAGADRSEAGRGVAPREITVAGDGWVRGQVVDEDGAAVSSGQLVLWCRRPDGTVARIRDGVLPLDEDGRFEGPACRGQICPELRHPSQIPAEEWVLESGVETTLESRSLPRLWGRVVDPDGTPVPAAQVVITPPPGEHDPTAVLPVVTARTSTDADGLFSVARIERPPCDPCQQARDACPPEELPVLEQVWVSARAAGWAPGGRLVDLSVDGDADDPVTVALASAEAAITGRLVDAGGQVLPRAVVLARSELRSSEQHQSDASDGVFAFDALGQGPYTVRAIQDGVELVRQAGVEPGAEVELRLGEILREVELRVVDEQDQPWPDVQIDGGPFDRQRSDADGRVRAQRVAPGSYILRVRPPGARARAHDLEVPGGVPGDEASVALRLAVGGGA